MSLEKIHFTSNELISFFIVSDPPENNNEFLPVFCPECQPPLDQSQFASNWKPKQQYHRQNNRYQIPLANSSSTTLGSTNISDNHQAPIQNTSSTPLTTFSPLSQQSNKPKYSVPTDSQPTNPSIINFQPASFQPTNQPIANFQPATTFQPTIPVNSNSQTTSFQPTTSFHPMTSLNSNTPPPTSFQPTNSFQPTTAFQPTSTFQSSNMETSNFQSSSFPSTILPTSNFQPTIYSPTNLSPSNFQPNSQPASFQPTIYQNPSLQTPSFQPQNAQISNFQPTYSQTPNYQPTNFQTSNFQPQNAQFQPQTDIQQPNFVYNQNISNYQYVPPTIADASNLQSQPLPQASFQPYQPSIPEPVNQEQFVEEEEEVQQAELEKQQQEDEEKVQRKEEQEQEQENKPSYSNLFYYKPNTQDESFQSVIDVQKDEAAEEEARQKEIQAQQQRLQEEQQQVIPESWANNSTPNAQDNQPSIETIIANQEYESTIEAQQQQEQETQKQAQQKKSQLNTWADSNSRPNSSPSAFEDIIASQKKSEPSNSSKSQMAKISKSNSKGKTVKMSLQELQREYNKPSGWGGPVMNAPVPSASEIIAAAASSEASATSTAATTKAATSEGKGKKGKKAKKEVYDYQSFYRMNEEQDKAKKEAIWANAANSPANPKMSFSTISAEAIMESEKNRASFPPPTTAPVTKRANHRGRGKEVLGVVKTSAPQKYKDSDDDDDDFYEPPRQPSFKPSFNAISNDEMKKQKTTQNQTPTTNVTSNATSQSKKKKAKYQVITDTNQVAPQSSWGKVTGSSATTAPSAASTSKTQSPKIAFDQIEQNEKVDQPTKASSTAASTGPAVQSKKKKKGTKKIIYLDDILHNHQGGSAAKPRYDSSSSDDEDYTRPRPGAKKNAPNFDAILQQETKNKKAKKQASIPSTVSISTKSPIKNQATNFDALYQQEMNRSSNKLQSPLQNLAQNKSNVKKFDSLLNDEAALEDHNINNIEIIDDTDFPKKKQQQQMQKQPNRAAPKPANSKKQGSSNKAQQEDNSELFWGRTSKNESPQDYQEYDDDYDDNPGDFQGFGRKTKIERDPKAAFLQNLIEKKLKTKGEDWYEYAQSIMNKDRNGLIRSLIAAGVEDSDAKSIAATFFKQYNK
ncbi:hypothetical protein M9Y10_009855 [Tritrichomonas musculus]|uniref:Uncharacterized protein n=1 Tax=Tritrichomonas musculus TaxID=1915356 RepID=A0ABR2IPR1_9EUKA